MVLKCTSLELSSSRTILSRTVLSRRSFALSFLALSSRRPLAFSPFAWSSCAERLYIFHCKKYVSSISILTSRSRFHCAIAAARPANRKRHVHCCFNSTSLQVGYCSLLPLPLPVCLLLASSRLSPMGGLKLAVFSFS